MKKLYLFLISLTISTLGFSQIYNGSAYSGQTITTCKGQFTSTVSNTTTFGSGSNGYSNNENYTVTFCSGSGPIRANFYWIDLETNYDYLYVYDGPNTTSPLIGTLNGGGMYYPGVFTSSGTCLTFKFVSDGSGRWGGWDCLLGCTPAPCGTNPVAADICSSAPTMCNLNGYCGYTSGWYTRDHGNIDAAGYGGSGPFCGSIQNNSWLSFIASSTTATIDITSSACIASGGVQAIVMSSPDCNSFTAVSNCISQGAMGLSTLNATGLTVGNKYYIMVDGLDGNDCRYDVAVGSGVQVITSSGPGSLCTGSSGAVSVSGYQAGSTFSWSASSAGAISGGTTGASITATPTVTTTYTCNVVSPGGCATQLITYNLTVNPLPVVTAGNLGPYCVGQTIALSSGGANTYSWSGPSAFSSAAQNPTRPVATAAMAGTYTVTGTSAANCVNTATTTVTVNALPVATASGGTFCVGSSITLGSGGGGTYSWAGPNSFSSSSQNPSIANATTAMGGTYTVTVTNAANCTATATALVTINQKPTATITGTASFCAGGSTTLSAATSTAGSGSISSYQWQLGGSNIGGATGSTYNATAAGTYNVIVTNSNTCATTSANFVVSSNAVPVATVTGTPTLCAGGSTTLSAATSSAGSGTISSYQWQLGGSNIGGATSSTYNAVAAGTYNVIVTNSNNCSTTSANLAVTVNAVPVATITGTASFCAGGNTTLSAATSTAGSGTISSYQWQLGGSNIGGATSSTYNAAAAGTYNVIVTNSNTCSKTSSNFAVTVNAVPVATVTGPSSLCSGGSTTLSAATSTAGSGSISGYQWQLGGSNIGGATGSTYSAVAAGTYNVIVTNTNACSSTSSNYAVTVNASPTATITGATAFCTGANTTLSAATSTAGSGTISTYQWQLGGSNIGGATASTYVATSAGTYNVIVTNSNTCTNTSANYVVTVNATPTAVASGTASFCAGGSTTLSAASSTAGSGSITGYQWQLGGSNIGGATSSTYAATAAGSYDVIVTNSNNCSNTSGTIAVTVNALPTATITGSTSMCNGGNVTLSAATSTAGSGSITSYQWQLGGSNIGGATSSTYNAVAAGTYNVIVTNSNTCTKTSANYVISINASPTATVTGPTAICSNGNITLSATSSLPGSGSISTYQWQLGGSNIAGATGSTYVATTGGTYDVIITNSNTCSSTSSNYAVSVNTAPTAVATGPSVVCDNGSVTLSAASSIAGSGSITGYQWQFGGSNIGGATSSTLVANSPGTYNVIVTNSNTCSATSSNFALAVNAAPTAAITGASSFCSNATDVLSAASSTAGSGSITSYQWQLGGVNIGGATASTYTASAAGNYQVIVSNSNSCSATSAITAVTILPAPAINSGSVVLNPSNCGASTGSITGITATGTGTLTYTWTNSVPTTISTSTTTANVLNIPAGTYNLAVSSTNGCSSTSGPYTIINPTAPAQPTANAASTSVCVGGSITVSTPGVGGGATYNWTGPNGFSSTAQNPPALTNVTAANGGVYSVTASSAGCTGPAGTVNVIVNANPTAAVSGTTSFCAGANSVLSATSSSAGSGSIANYQWQLNGASIGGATASTYTATAAGNYSVIVTNTNNCANTSSNTTITVNANPTATVTGAASFCSGANTVLSAATSTAGSGTISSYQWQLNGSNILGGTASTYTATAAGNYSVIITNSNTCTKTSATTAVSINANPTATVTGSTSFCNGTNSVLSATSSTAGSGAISGYQWQLNGVNIGGATASTYTATAAGNYSVIVTNSNSCSNTSSATVESVNANPTATITGSSSFCSGTNEVLSAISSSAGSGSITGYQWQLNGVNIGGATASTYTATAAGNYSVIVTNSNTCSATSSASVVSTNANPTATVSGASSFCSGANTVLSAASSTAGSGSITGYQWQLNGTNIGGATASTYTATGAGNYSVIITNSNSCTNSSAAASVAVNANPTASITGTSSFCSGQSSVLDGSSSVAGSGSITGYQWQLNGSNIAGATSATYTATGAGNYSLVVTNSNTCTNTSATSVPVTVYSNPTAIVSGTPIFCAGTSSVLSSITSTPGSGAITGYQWQLNGVNISGATSATYTATGPGNYSLIVSDVNNCSNTSAATVVTVNAVPTAGIQGSATSCSGISSSLSSNSTAPNPATITGYQWQLNGLDISGATSSSYNASSAGNYNLIVVNSNGCSDTSITYVFGLTPVPTAVIQGTDTICVGQNAVLNGTSSTPGTGSITGYQWQLNGADIAGATAATYSATVAGNYSLIVTNSGTCSDTSTATAITVFNTPTSSLTGTNNFCAGGNTVLSGSTSTAGSGIISGFQWVMNGTPLAGETASTYIATAAGNYSLIITNSNNCFSSSATFTVSVNANPVVSLIGSDSICAGANSILDASASTAGSGTISSYQWQLNGTNIGGATSSTYTANASGIYTVFVKNTNNCLDSTALTLTVNAIPTAITTSTTNTICTNTSSVLDASNSNAGSGTITGYQWQLNGVNIAGQTASTYTATTAGTYAVIVTNSNSCVNTSSTTIIAANQAPTAFATGNTSYCAGQSTTLDASTSIGGSSGITTYQWILNGTPIASSNTITYSVIQPGTYDVIVTNADNCNDTSATIVVVENQLPVISGTVVMTQSACNGSTGSLVGVTVTGTPGFTYTWSNSVPAVISTSTTSPDLTSQPADIYNLSVTDGNGCINTFGPDTISNFGSPMAPTAAIPSDYCQGATVSPLTASGTGAITWYSDATLTTQMGTGSPFNTGVTSVTPGAFDFWVTQTQNGCEGPSVQVTIKVNPTPIAPTAANPPAYCQGQTAQPLIANGGSGVITWYSDAALTTIAGTNSPFVSGATSTTSYWIAESIGSCQGPATQVTVTFNPLPPAPAVASSTVTSCQGQTVNPLTATGTTGVLNWYSDSLLTTQIGTGSPFTSGATSTDTFYVAETLTGCTGPYSAIYVTVNPTPSLSGTAAVTDEQCGSANGAITGLIPIGGTPGYTINWTNATGTTVGSANDLTNVSAGTYSVVVTDANNCSANAGPFILNGTGNVVAAFTPDVITGTAPLTVNYANSSTGALTYAWDFGNTTTSTQSNPQNTFTVIGTYTVTLVAINGPCKDTATAVITVDVASTIVIPNIFSPNNDGLNDVFTIFTTGIKDLNADIFNRWGQRVFTITGPGQAWDGKLANGDFASEGTYFYMLKATGYDGKDYKKEGSMMLVK